MFQDQSRSAPLTQAGKPLRAEIISIGTEILQGEIVDTDSAYLAGRLRLLGIELTRISSVGDDLPDLTAALKTTWERSDLVLTTGGLGPTADDLTREAIAAMLGEQLSPDASLEQGLLERFARIGMTNQMPASNLKQTLLIPSARPLRNTEGTAPGWWVEKDRRILIALPGPPRELEPMWLNEIEPHLRTRSTVSILTKTFKIGGLSEAAVGEMVAPLFSVNNPYLGIYAKSDGIHLRFIARAGKRELAEEMIAGGERAVRAALDKHIWGTDGDTLEGVTAGLLRQMGLILAVMEDYTAGLLTATLAELPESRTFFRGGLTATSDASKTALGVEGEIVARHGSASPEAARAMAKAVRTLLKADIGVGITAASETQQGSGKVYIAIVDEKPTVIDFRARNRRNVVNATLLELRKLLLARD